MQERRGFAEDGRSLGWGEDGGGLAGAKLRALRPLCSALLHRRGAGLRRVVRAHQKGPRHKALRLRLHRTQIRLSHKPCMAPGNMQMLQEILLCMWT